MSEKNDKSDDVVEREAYNKIVEAHNALKLEKEKLETEKKELMKKIEDENENKQMWKKENEEINKKMEDLAKKVTEKKDDTVVAKGVVPDRTPKSTVNVTEHLDKLFPVPSRDPRMMEGMNKYGYYKSGIRQYTDEQLGMALSLQGTMQTLDPMFIPAEARANKEDIIIRR